MSGDRVQGVLLADRMVKRRGTDLLIHPWCDEAFDLAIVCDALANRCQNLRARQNPGTYLETVGLLQLGDANAGDLRD